MEPSDENVGPALIISSSVLLFLVLITTTLRLLVRARNRMLGWDDLTIVLVAILSATRLGCQIAQVHYGDGRHRYYIENADYKTANRLGWYALLLFFVAICLMKISICLLLLRIKNERWLQWLIYGMMAGLVLTNGGVVIILLAECRPVDEYWDDVGNCWDPRVRVFSIYLTIGYAILTDLLCSCLPLVVIWKVRIPLKSKLLVCGLMSLGLLATGCGIGRAASLTVLTIDFTCKSHHYTLVINIKLTSRVQGPFASRRFGLTASSLSERLLPTLLSPDPSTYTFSKTTIQPTAEVEAMEVVPLESTAQTTTVSEVVRPTAPAADLHSA